MIDYSINICTLHEYFQYGDVNDTVIIDEYDTIFGNEPYYLINNSIHGIWELKNRKVIAFSATSSGPIERFINGINPV